MAKPQTNFINEGSVLCGAHALYATKNKPSLPANFSTLSDADKVAALVTAWRGVTWTANRVSRWRWVAGPPRALPMSA